MVSSDTLLNCPDWMIPFTAHTDDSDKQLGAVVSKNRKHIAFSQQQKNPHCNYTTT